MSKIEIKQDESGDKQVKLRKPKTLLQNIERIIELSEGSKLSDDFYKSAKSSINAVAKTMNLTPNQAVMFAVFIEKSDDTCIRMHDLSGFLGCKNIKTIGMMSDIDELEKRRLVRCSTSRERLEYRVPVDVINAVKQNIVYQPQSTKNLTIHELFSHIEQLFEEKENKEISLNVLFKEFDSLFEENPSLTFCKRLKAYNEKYCQKDFYLLLIFCHFFVNKDDNDVTFYDIEDFYESSSQFRQVKSALRKGEHCLLSTDVIEYKNDNGFEDKETFRLSAKTKENLFEELDTKIIQAEKKKGLIFHKDIISKPLYYNEREKTQIAQLTALLNKENFASVQTKLEKNGMRKGFACLFYGSPGTGKTETVHQIARQTERDIMMVDISQTKSCWFGESEKQIKEVFEKYKARVKASEIAPILLFNEADAVIGKRKDSASGSVAQTENAIQNIILQEMENLEGIMIATTNLTQNFDKAFERRFLYKIEFDKPDVDAKEKIWQTMLPALSENERLELAKKYSFSGGQIENIVRKYTVDAILNGTEPSFESVQSYCQTEFLYKDDVRKKIGFTNNG